MTRCLSWNDLAILYLEVTTYSWYLPSQNDNITTLWYLTHQLAWSISRITKKMWTKAGIVTPHPVQGLGGLIMVRRAKTHRTDFSILCEDDRASWIIWRLTNSMHCLSSVHWVITPLHVSGISAAHHQEEECVYVPNATCTSHFTMVRRHFQ
jgi:hypothetical protein